MSDDAKPKKVRTREPAAPVQVSDKTPKFSPDFKDKSADIQLASVEGTIFRIHSYFLQAHSTVFRNMIAAIPKDTDNFTHEPILIDASNAALTRFLQIITTTNLVSSEKRDKGTYLELIRLCDIFDTPVVRIFLCNEIQGQFNLGNLSGWDGFVMASKLDNAELAKSAIRKFKAGDMSCFTQGQWTEARLGEPTLGYVARLLNAAAPLMTQNRGYSYGDNLTAENLAAKF